MLLGMSSGLMAYTPGNIRLTEGEEQRGILYVDRDDGWYRTYTFDIPVSTVAFRIRVLEATGDVDLFLRYGEGMDDYSTADFYSESDDWLEELHLCKAYETWLPAGRYYLDVAYQLDDPPRSNGRIESEIPFSLQLDIFDGMESLGLEAGEVTEGLLDDEGGYLSFYHLDIPEDMDAFRLDVLDSPGDVDIFLSRGNPAPTRDGYHTISDTMIGRESLQVESQGEDLTGRWYVMILEAVESDYPVPFSLVFTPGSGVPENAPEPPVLRDPLDPMDAGRIATVQLAGPWGIGSGCLVGNEGYILTNHHVVVGMTEELLDEMVVAVSVDPYQVPVEAYRAVVVASSPEDDLALLKITADRWGRPLPADLEFPGWRLGDPGGIRPGEPVMVLGYPWIGSGMSRPYFTITRGILSGGEITPRGLLLKTDAVISGGGSGGAVTDGGWRLLGLPSFVVSEDGAQLTYFIPVDRIPRDWRDLFRYE